jgi:hypothetical protein
VRRAVVVLASLGLAIVGSQLAHGAVYRIVAPNAHERTHLLADTGHAYLRFAPLGLAVVCVLLGMALVAEWRSAGDGATRLRPRPSLFVVVAPVLFVFQEHFERLLHDGAFPLAAATDRTFLLGLVLQLPFALAAYALARLSLAATRVARRLLSPPRPRRAGAVPAWVVGTVDEVRSRTCGCSLGPRAPPVSAL